jgi:hypothetical protein
MFVCPVNSEIAGDVLQKRGEGQPLHWADEPNGANQIPEFFVAYRVKHMDSGSSYVKLHCACTILNSPPVGFLIGGIVRIGLVNEEKSWFSMTPL